MQLSKRFQLLLSDVLNTIKHIMFVVSVTVITAAIEYFQNGQQIDWQTIKLGCYLAVLNGLLVLVNRYLSDNSGSTASPK